MATYLITGASRGIGLALITYLASLPDSMVKTVIGTHRDQSPALKDLEQKHCGRVLTVPMEVTNEDSIKEAARLIQAKLEGQGIDYLVNNAGVMPVSPQGIESMYVTPCIHYLKAHPFAGRILLKHSTLTLPASIT